jgi:hypothetical protein
VTFLIRQFFLASFFPSSFLFISCDNLAPKNLILFTHFSYLLCSRRDFLLLHLSDLLYIHLKFLFLQHSHPFKKISIRIFCHNQFDTPQVLLFPSIFFDLVCLNFQSALHFIPLFLSFFLNVLVSLSMPN